jgi:hypothetical protein
MSLSNLEAFAKPVTRELPKDPHEEFSRAYPKETVWVYTSDFGFAIKMRDVLKQYGYLTPGQLAAVHRCMDSEASYKERQAIRGCTPEQTKIMLDRQVGGVDLTKVPSGLYAVPGGDTRLKVKIQRGTGRWQGWIFVTDGAVYGEQRKYGAQRPGYTYDGQIQPQLRTIAADPRAASAAYGKLTGTCGVCGRHLEDEESVARGIGPVCAEKQGW